MTNFVDHLTRQFAVSRAIFGPKRRMEGVLKHIEEEVEEVRESDGSEHEWVDLVILSLDGLMRQISHRYPSMTAPQVAGIAFELIRDKQSANEMRTWPDWRTVSEDAPINHDRTKD